MTLYQKILSLYPQITDQEMVEYIRFRNDSDEKGEYISKWEHPTYPRPTDEELARIQ
jgi:XkdW protein